MNVLITHSAQEYDEAAASAFDLAEALCADGHQVMVVVKRGSAFDYRITARRLQMRRVGYSGDWLGNRRDGAALRDLIWAFRPDVIHCHGQQDATLARAARTTAKKSVPIVLTCPEWSGGTRPHEYDALIATSKKVYTATGPDDNVTVLYPAIEPALFHPARRNFGWRRQCGVADNEKLVALLLPSSDSSSAELLLQCIPDILKQAPRARFLFAPRRNGDFRAVAEVIHRHRESSRLLFEDVIEDLPLLLASSDVGLVIRERGSAARSALEYLACGTPVVAESLTGAQEVVEDGRTGLYVKAQSEIIEATARILNDVAFAREALAASETIRQEHDRTVWVHKVLQVYETASARAGHSPTTG